MRRHPTTESLFLTLIIAAFSPARAALSDESSTDKTDSTLTEVTQPAFALAERITDGVYDFVHWNVFDPVLPAGLSRELASIPDKDSTSAMSGALRRREWTYFQQLQSSFTVPPIASQGRNPTADPIESAKVAGDQLGILQAAFSEALLDRYGLSKLGEKTGEYAKDPGHWDGTFGPLAGAAGGAALYLNGLHGNAQIGRMNLGIDLAAPMKLRGGSASHAAAVELRYKNTPLVLASSWDYEHGSFGKERLSFLYSLRY